MSVTAGGDPGFLFDFAQLRYYTENMPKFHVNVREVHVSTREVKAESAEEAIRKVKDQDAEEVVCEYSHTLGEDTWTVEEA